MKVPILLFLLSIHVPGVDAWSTTDHHRHRTVPRGATKFGSRNTPSSVLMAPKARGSPLWGTTLDDHDDDEALEQFRVVRNSQRRVKQLMDRGMLLREQIAESPFQASFFWLSEQLYSLTTHLRTRFEMLKEFANLQANAHLSEQDWQLLGWLDDELQSAQVQLQEYGRLLVETLPGRPDADALNRELEELQWLSQQIEQAMVDVPEEHKQEMEEAYNRAQVSLGRLSELTRELASMESALNNMEQQEPFLGYVQTGQQDMAKELEIATRNALPVTVTTTGTPISSASRRSRFSSTQLNSQLVASADMFYEDDGDQQGDMSTTADQSSWTGFTSWWQGNAQQQEATTANNPGASEWQPRTTFDSTLYDERSEKVAASAAAGSSRWGSMETERAQKGSSIGGPAPGSPPSPSQPPSPQHHSGKSLYDMRTEQVASAGAAGKSRWGVMEVQLATVLSGRVLEDAPVPIETVYPPAHDTYLYDQRTETVAAAAAAGKSRWGQMENLRATLLAEGGSTTSPAAATGAQPPPAETPTTRPGTQETKKVSKMAPSSVSAPKAPIAPGDTSLFDARAAQIAAAGAMGKSRWGSMEVERATNTAGLNQALDVLSNGLPKSSYVPVETPVAKPLPRGQPLEDSLFDMRNKQVAAAWAVGQSRWGAMEGERATNAAGLKQALDMIGPAPQGVTSPQPDSPPAPQETTMAPPSTPSHPKDSSLFDLRNQQVAAASAAGQSRWGSMENEKAAKAAAASPPAVDAQAVPSQPKGASLFDLRNQQVAAASAAGQSRWGSMETERATNSAGLNQALDVIASGLPKSSYVPPTAPASSGASGPKGTPSELSLFDMRNQQVAKSSAAGQSRWGSMENERAYNAVGLKQALDIVGPAPEGVRKTPVSPPSPPMMESSPPAPSQPKGSAADPMQALAREWAAMNRDVDSKPPTPSPPPASPPMMESPAAPVAETLPAPVTPKGSTAAAVDPMEVLAREWAAMNRDTEGSPSKASPTPVQAPPPPPAAVAPPTEPPASATPPPESGASAVTMEQLASEWAAMNLELDSPSSSPPAVQPPAPAPEPVAVAPAPAPASSSLTDLAAQWSARNQDVDSVYGSAAVPAPAPVTPPKPPRAMENDWDRLAREWMQMNNSDD